MEFSFLTHLLGYSVSFLAALITYKQLSEYIEPRRNLQKDGGSVKWKGHPTRNIHFVNVKEEKVFLLIHWALGLL